MNFSLRQPYPQDLLRVVGKCFGISEKLIILLITLKQNKLERSGCSQITGNEIFFQYLTYSFEIDEDLIEL